MKIIKYDKWYLILQNGCIDYTQEEQYASNLTKEQAETINHQVKGRIVL